MTPVILASLSASRAAMLKAAGVAFETRASNVDEGAVKEAMVAGGKSARDVAVALADAKALAVPAAGRGLTIGADQTLDLDGALVDKAPDLTAVRARLKRLRGRRHTLHAAASVARSGKVIWRTVESAHLTMRPFSHDFLEAYVAQGGEALLGSVGCYHLEGAGAQLFEKVEGDYFAVLGLPLIALLEVLRAHGALAA